MNLLELKDKIKSHLIAGYPGLYIHSGEEARVDSMLQDVAAQLRLNPKEWNLGYGWVDFFNKQPRGSQGADTDLASSLPALLDDDLDHKLFIIKDARSALDNQPLAVARLKQLLNRIQRHHSGKAAVVLVSETLHIPPQIEAQITLLPLPLPRGEEISEQLEQLCQRFELTVPENLRQRLHAACSGLSQEEIRSALAMVRQQHEQINDAALALIQHEKEQIIAKSGVLEMLRVSENATDIGGLENLKQWLQRRAQIFRRLGEARTARVQAPKGVLIAGMPGCGKSLTAKAAAGLFQLPLLRLDIGSLLGKYVGESEHNMRRALTMAESVSPCILWIDELEKAFVGMTSGSGSEVSSRLFGYFLTWMQEKTGAVFVIATANNITALPPELLRKGRFDEVFYVGFPNGSERGAILDIHLKGDALELKQDERHALVRQCRDYAGADIQNAINEARETAFLENRALKFDDLQAAIKLTVPLRETLRDQVGKYEELFEKLKLKPASTCDGLSVAEMIKLADSHNALRRKEVATHEDCPDDLLEKLAGDTDLDVRTAVYSNPKCPEGLLTLRINIAADQPGYDLALLHLACMHANAPHDLLASQFERLQLSIEQKVQLAVMSDHEALHRRLLGDADQAVRSHLASNDKLNGEIQQLLGKDPLVAVRCDLARNDNLHAETQALLARDESFEVREVLARLAQLGEAVQLTLSQDEDVDVRLELAERTRDALLPESVQLVLVKDCLEVRQALAGNENLGAAAQLLLAQDHRVEVRQTLARHPALASATLQCLLKDVEAVQVELADNTHLGSALVQMGLSHSESPEVRKALAGNRQLNVEVQTRLLADTSEAVRKALAGNPGISLETSEALMHDSNDDVREYLVSWPQKPAPSVQAHLANDASASIRKYLARREELSETVQQRLANDLAQVQCALAGNACITAAVQRHLLEHGDSDTRRALAGNEALSGPVQARLAEDPSVEVRVTLARNAALALEVADKLIMDQADVRKELACNRHLGEAHYARLFKSGGEEVRLALAVNPEIGEALMTQIAQLEAPAAARPAASGAALGAVVGSATNMAVGAGIFGGLLGNTGRVTAAATAAATVAARAAATVAWLDEQNVIKPKLLLAHNHNLPVALQTLLLTQGEQSVELHEGLAGNPALAPELQSVLATHKEVRVRQKLADNPNRSEEVERLLLNDPQASVRAALIREHGWLEPDMELQLARDKAVSVRLALAGNDWVRKPAQLLLAVDPDKSVRSRLLQRPDGVTRRLERKTQQLLAQDSDLEVRKLLAVYPELDFAAQLLLAEDPAVSVREILAKGAEDNWFGTKLNEEVQARLARDAKVSVRLALAENHRLCPAAQARLAADADRSVKTKLLEESGFMNPLSLLAQQVLASDADSEVRKELVDKLFGVFAFPSSEEIHMKLANDPDETVRMQIMRNLLWPYNRGTCSNAVKERLLEGDDGSLRKRLEEVERERQVRRNEAL
ncbi:AAA family ATPase [Pseudomonas japonica]|uniref:AAA family ATPase n=1 Tax=Pseudomonas japonica TaxID=256466 RepID=UPI003801BFB2